MDPEIPHPLTGLVARGGYEGAGLAGGDTTGNDIHGTLTKGPVWVAGRTLPP